LVELNVYKKIRKSILFVLRKSTPHRNTFRWGKERRETMICVGALGWKRREHK